MNLLKRFKKPVFIAIIAIVVLTSCQNKNAKNDGWKDLFDGKTLNGWKVLNQDWKNSDSKPDFYVEDNMIVCNTTLNNSGGGYLVTEKSYDNFIIELDVKIDTSLNSGIQCRSQVWKRDTVTTFLTGRGAVEQSNWRAGYVWGYQIEVDPTSRTWSGGLYEPGNRGWLVTLADNKTAGKAFKPMDWNHFKIIMDGNKIQSWVNGVLVIDTIDDMSVSGFIGLQFHGAGREWQKNKKSMWKNIKIKELNKNTKN